MKHGRCQKFLETQTNCAKNLSETQTNCAKNEKCNQGCSTETQTNCTKNHENGTISIPTINLGSAALSSHLSHLPIMFINAIAIKMNANTKYTTFDTSIHISLR